ncbi:hypothetical protein [Ensifer sp. LC163]|nr:hypothetical protein [Ensifer sp. LC163]
MKKISSGLDAMVQRFIEGEVKDVRTAPNRFTTLAKPEEKRAA